MTFQIIRYFDANDYLCPKGKCSTYSDDGANLYMDFSHLSYRGARILGREIIDKEGTPTLFASAFRDELQK